ncbi:hypothetical protein OESDEN_04671 [Oesophagostomum dentatum]|uniref:Retrotransposon gag domain-containing protein n=1 Tax=Oesophagostomum dentatum TaxID=61180 RepID=A0A0B1TDM7_OESDE|nr:hypothetical protein OESDEN_04671 [Oesophagostomum dentatum]
MTDEMDIELDRILEEDEAEKSRVEVLQRQVEELMAQMRQVAEASKKEVEEYMPGGDAASTPAKGNERPQDRNQMFRGAFKQLQGKLDVEQQPLLTFDAVKAAECDSTYIAHLNGQQESHQSHSHKNGHFQSGDAGNGQTLQDQLNLSRDSSLRGRYSLDNKSSHWDYSVGATLATMTLPDVPNFGNSQGKGFNQFVTSFIMKYGRIGLTDDMLIHLMSEIMEGQPKALVRTLPSSARCGRFEDFISALSAKFSEDSPVRRMEAHVKLKRLKMGKSVAEYCVELKWFTQDANPEAAEKDLSVSRASELLTQLTQWPEYFQLFAAMGAARQEEAYGVLKNLVLRIERSGKVAAEVQAVAEGPQTRTTVNYRQTYTRSFKGINDASKAETASGNSKHEQRKLESFENVFIFTKAEVQKRGGIPAGAHAAIVKRRLYLKPGGTKELAVQAGDTAKDRIMWSSNEIIPNSICSATQSTGTPVTNTTDEPKVFKVGDKIGYWEENSIVEQVPIEHVNMLERTSTSFPNRWETLLTQLSSNKSQQLDDSIKKVVI